MLTRRKIIKNALLGVAALGSSAACKTQGGEPAPATAGAVQTAPASVSSDDPNPDSPSAVNANPDSINLRDFGAVGDGETDDWDAVQAAVDFCLQSGNALYVPTGRYVLRQSEHANQPIRLDNLTADGQGLKIYGDGPGSSVFVEAPGQTEIVGRYTKLFYFYSGGGGFFGFNAGDFIFEDIGFDKNSGSNSAPPGPYAWEQAHAIAFNGRGTLETRSVTFNRVGFFNKIGAYINHSGGNAIKKFSVSNIFFEPMSEDAAVWGERGDLELSGTNGVNIVDGVTADFMQIEPVESLKASASNTRKTIIANSEIKTIQFGEHHSLIMGDAKYSTLYLNNVICEKQLSLRNVSAIVYNSTVNLSNIYNTPGNLKATNCTILLDYDPMTNTVTPVRIRVPVDSIGGLAEASFSNCSFDINADEVLPGATGFAIEGLRKVNNVAEVVVTLDHCTFDERLYGSIDAYGYGKFHASNCRIAGQVKGIQAGGYWSYGSDVRSDNNDFSRVVGDWVHIQAHNTHWVLAVNGSYPAADWKLRVTGSTGLDGYRVKADLQ